MELPRKRAQKKNWSMPKPHVWSILYQRADSQMSTPPRTVAGRAGCFFLILYPASAATSFFTHHRAHTPSHTHHLTHTIFHTPTLSHTISFTQLCHTPSFTHQLCHTPSFTHQLSHNFVTHHLSQTNFITHHLSHTIFVPHHLPHTNFVGGVALGDIQLPFAWQAWTFVLRGKRGTWWHPPALVARLGALWSPGAPRHFAWQAWHLATSTFVLRARHGAWWHPPSFRVAGVALGDIHLLWWRAWARFGRPGRRATLRARRGTWRHPPSFCAAGMALGDIHLRFAWQAWRLGHWAGSGGALGRASVARGRRGPWWHPCSFLLDMWLLVISLCMCEEPSVAVTKKLRQQGVHSSFGRAVLSSLFCLEIMLFTRFRAWVDATCDVSFLLSC